MNPDIYDSRCELLKATTSLFKSRGLLFSVVHGLEKTPTELGRDVDILLDKSSEPFLLEDFHFFLRKQNYNFYHHYNPVGTHQFLFHFEHPGQSPFGFEVDFLTRLKLRWGPIIFTLNSDPTRPYSDDLPIPYNPWASFVKRFLIKLLAGHWDTLSVKHHDWAIHSEDRELIFDKISYFFDETLAQELFFAIENYDIKLLRTTQPKLRRSLYLNPLKTPKGWWYWLTEEVAPFLKAKQGAPTLCLHGPDGVGKSTIIDLLRTRILKETVYPKMQIKHWRPGLLPPLARFKGADLTQSSAPVAPRKNIGRFGLLRQFYYTIDFIIGYWFIDRIKSNGLTFLIYDRGFLDMVVHPVRFGFPSSVVPRLLGRFCRRPDLVLLLIDEPSEINKRKNELSTTEICQQYTTWNKLLASGHIDATILCSNGPECAIDQILNLLYKHLKPRERYFAGLPSITD